MDSPVITIYPREDGRKLKCNVVADDEIHDDEVVCIWEAVTALHTDSRFLLRKADDEYMLSLAAAVTKAAIDRGIVLEQSTEDLTEKRIVKNWSGGERIEEVRVGMKVIFFWKGWTREEAARRRSIGIPVSKVSR